MSDDLIAEAITEAFGERCPDYEPECFCCKAWMQYDRWKSDVENTRAATPRDGTRDANCVGTVEVLDALVEGRNGTLQ